MIRFFTVFFRITVNYLVGGILMGIFLGGVGIVFWWGARTTLTTAARLAAAIVALAATGVLLYELGVTYFQLGLFFFLATEYSAESWQAAAKEVKGGGPPPHNRPLDGGT